MWLLRVTAMASSNMMKMISLWYHTSSWLQILEQSASASSQMIQMCLCCSFIGCIVTVSTPLCRWRDGIDQFGISMPPVPNSAPSACRFLGMHYLFGSVTTSYLHGKGKVSALKTLRAGDFPGLHSVLGEQGAIQAQLLEVGQGFFCSLYGQPAGTTMGEARYRLYTRKCGRPLKLMSLPPTELNLFLHILRAHL